MSNERKAKDKEMSSNLKAAGVARSTMRCPVTYKLIHSNTRITPSENNSKGNSHFDFAGALHASFNNRG